MKNSLEYIVKSWVENLDVEPYALDIEEAKAYIEYGYISPDDTDDEITPEKIVGIWNRIVAELKFGTAASLN